MSVQAQSGTPLAPSTPPPPTQSPATTVDIRIQGEGISLPKGLGESPPPEKPPAK